jgi:hypothetical protein
MTFNGELELLVADVESIAARAVEGYGDQAELLIRTCRGTLTMRLLARHGQTVQLPDLRGRIASALAHSPFGDDEARFSVSCRHCGCVVLTAARIGTELALLREHVREKHPRVELPANADAGAVLTHFDG